MVIGNVLPRFVVSSCSENLARPLSEGWWSARSKEHLLLSQVRRFSHVSHVAHLSRPPWLCPIGSVEPGGIPVVDVIICPDTAQAEDVCERRVDTHVKQRGAGHAWRRVGCHALTCSQRPRLQHGAVGMMICMRCQRARSWRHVLKANKGHPWVKSF
jgi:hypothetical protein